MRKLNLPAETIMVFKSHAASIEAVNNKTAASTANTATTSSTATTNQ
jgi:hypothetical protein